MHQAIMNIEPITHRASTTADQVPNGADLVGFELEDAGVTTQQLQTTKGRIRKTNRTPKNPRATVEQPTYERLTNRKAERYIFYNHCHISKKGNPRRVPN
jgi:hypothetical protein